MPLADTDVTNLIARQPSRPCLEAVTLVHNHPGCTLGELVSLSEAGQGDEPAHDAARAALLPALHQAVARGHLITGPQRWCREHGVKTTTWMPGSALDQPLQPAQGLRGLIMRTHRTIAQLDAEEAQA